MKFPTRSEIITSMYNTWNSYSADSTSDFVDIRQKMEDVLDTIDDLHLQGPFMSAFDADRTGIIKEELVQYKMVGDMLTRITATRDYDGTDYTDSIVSTPLVKTNYEKL